MGLFDSLVSVGKSIAGGLGKAAGYAIKQAPAIISQVLAARGGAPGFPSGGAIYEDFGRYGSTGGFAGPIGAPAPASRVYDPSVYGGEVASSDALGAFLGGVNAPVAGRTSTLSGSALSAVGNNMSLVYRSSALPGGAPVAASLGGALVSAARSVLPTIAGSAALGAAGGALYNLVTPSRRGMPRLLMQTTPAGNPTWYRHVGQPILFSGDLSICKRVRKVAGKARSRVGGR